MASTSGSSKPSGGQAASPEDTNCPADTGSTGSEDEDAHKADPALQQLDDVRRDQAVFQLVFTFPCSLPLVMLHSWFWLVVMSVAVLGPLFVTVFVILPATDRATKRLQSRLSLKLRNSGVAGDLDENFEFTDSNVQKAYDRFCLVGGNIFRDNVLCCAKLALPGFVVSALFQAAAGEGSYSYKSVAVAAATVFGLLVLVRGVLVLIFGPQSSRALNAVLSPISWLAAFHRSCWSLWDLPQVMSNVPITCSTLGMPSQHYMLTLLLAPTLLIILAALLTNLIYPLVPAEGRLMPAISHIVIWLGMTFWMSQDEAFLNDTLRQVVFHGSWSFAVTIPNVFFTCLSWRLKEQSL
eukprot:scaffold297542_cov33-Prasinocladus_malaysianus.AAC.1